MEIIEQWINLPNAKLFITMENNKQAMVSIERDINTLEPITDIYRFCSDILNETETTNITPKIKINHTTYLVALAKVLHNKSITIKINSIIDHGTKKYGYRLTISRNGLKETKTKLYQATDFLDVNKKSAMLKGIIDSLNLALKLPIQTLNLYLEDDTFIKLTKETAVARSNLSLQALDSYKSCVKKNIAINLNTYSI